MTHLTPQSTSRPIRRVSLTDSIAQELYSQMMNGQLQPGMNLREVELAQELGVSRQSVREALAQLKAEGLLDHEMHRGYKVPVLNRDDAIEIFQLRELIECEAARRLSRDQSGIALLDQALEQIERLDPDAGWVPYIELHFNFHRAIVAATGSQRLLRHSELCLSEAWVSLLPSRHSEVYGSPDAQRAGHRSIVDAIRSGDEQRAALALHSHLWSGFDDLYPVHEPSPRVSRGHSNEQ